MRARSGGRLRRLVIVVGVGVKGRLEGVGVEGSRGGLVVVGVVVVVVVGVGSRGGLVVVVGAVVGVGSSGGLVGVDVVVEVGSRGGLGVVGDESAAMPVARAAASAALIDSGIWVVGVEVVGEAGGVVVEGVVLAVVAAWRLSRSCCWNCSYFSCSSNIDCCDRPGRPSRHLSLSLARASI